MRVLAGVDVLVLEELDDLVEGGGDEGAYDGADPVDPVLGLELAGDDAGAQAAGRVEAAARVVDAAELGDEESQADADGRDERCPVLFGRQHEDGEDELEGQDRLDEAALRQVHAGGQGRAHVERRWEHARRQPGRRDAAGALGREDEDAAEGRDGLDENEGQCHLREQWISHEQRDEDNSFVCSGRLTAGLKRPPEIR